MKIKRIEKRVKINYRECVEKIVNDESLKIVDVIIWLLKELTTLQKYILELLMDRVDKQIKIKELLK